MATTDIPDVDEKLYNVSDPLLRRLRLEEPSGEEITDLARAFAEQDLLVLYAGSAHGAQNLAGLHRTLMELMVKDKAIAVIYVSTDTDPKTAAIATSSLPWIRMIFNDDSDFAAIATSEPEVPEAAGGEEFVQAAEIEIKAEVVPYGEEEEGYVRPLSRAAVAMSMMAYSTPSIAVYHIPSHQFVARNVKASAFSASRVEETLAKWHRGEQTGHSFNDFIVAIQWPLFFLFLAVLYHAAVYFLGRETRIESADNSRVPCTPSPHLQTLMAFRDITG